MFHKFKRLQELLDLKLLVFQQLLQHNLLFQELPDLQTRLLSLVPLFRVLQVNLLVQVLRNNQLFQDQPELQFRLL